jgi:hypothetical protein
MVGSPGTVSSVTAGRIIGVRSVDAVGSADDAGFVDDDGSVDNGAVSTVASGDSAVRSTVSRGSSSDCPFPRVDSPSLPGLMV